MTAHAHLLWAAGGFSLLMAAGPSLLLPRLAREELVRTRLRALQSKSMADLDVKPTGGRALRFVGGIGRALMRSGLLPGKTVLEMQATLAQAGLRGPAALAIFLGFKASLAPSLPLLMILVAPGGLWGRLIVAASFVVGLLGPDVYIKRKRKNHLKAVQDGLSDALDLLVICAEAGLGLEPAITRVGEEIVQAHPSVAQEFALTASELRVVADRRVAIANLGERTGLESLKRLGSTLVQTMQYGTPLAGALRTLASELRDEKMTRFEARAARLPVMLTVPMIVFILPCLFLVVGGPAIIQVAELFK